MLQSHSTVHLIYLGCAEFGPGAAVQPVDGSTEHGGSGTLTAVRGEHRPWWLRHAHSCSRGAQNMVAQARSQLFEGSTEHGGSGTLTASGLSSFLTFCQVCAHFFPFCYVHLSSNVCNLLLFLLSCHFRLTTFCCSSWSENEK